MPDLRWVLPCVAIAVFVSALIGGAFVDLGPAGAPARVGDSATLYGRRVPDDGRTAGLAAVAACAGTGDARGNPPRARLARGRICEGSPGLGGQVAPEDQPTGLFLELVDAVSTFRDFVGFPAAGSDARP